MATYGKIDEYDESEECTQYVERMDHYFEANEIEEYDKKRSIFFSVLGAKTYKLVRGLTRPATPKDKTYKELTEIIKKHYVPKPSVIVQRYKFNIRVRKTGESIWKYAGRNAERSVSLWRSVDGKDVFIDI